MNCEKTFLTNHLGGVDFEGARFNTTRDKSLSTETQICDYFASCLYVRAQRTAKDGSKSENGKHFWLAVSVVEPASEEVDQGC